MFCAVTALLTIGEVSERTGVAASALRFYEQRGLVSAVRARPTTRRCYHPDVLARIEFIRRTQLVGLSLDEIAGYLARLPRSRPPTERHWRAVAQAVAPRLSRQLEVIAELRAQLDEGWLAACLPADR